MFEADVVVVGSGAGGMCAAIVAHDHGLETIVVEKTPLVGGTTAISGSIPANFRIASIDSQFVMMMSSTPRSPRRRRLCTSLARPG